VRSTVQGLLERDPRQTASDPIESGTKPTCTSGGSSTSSLAKPQASDRTDAAIPSVSDVIETLCRDNLVDSAGIGIPGLGDAAIQSRGHGASVLQICPLLLRHFPNIGGANPVRGGSGPLDPLRRSPEFARLAEQSTAMLRIPSADLQRRLVDIGAGPAMWASNPAEPDAETCQQEDAVHETLELVGSQICMHAGASIRTPLLEQARIGVSGMLCNLLASPASTVVREMMVRAGLWSILRRQIIGMMWFHDLPATYDR